MKHASFTTTSRGLDREALPMRLYEKAKRLGIWNPSDLDFSRDRRDWLTLSAPEQDLILRLTALFQAGEEAVTLDLLPLIQAIAREGRLEEEMYLTTFLWEEAKHTDFFSRFLGEVAGVSGADLSRYHTPDYRAVFYEALPDALQRLSADPAPANQVRAAVTYNMIVEGMLAETGYHAFFEMLESHELMPALRDGIRLLKQDESRHIAYGLYLLSRLMAADQALWAVVEETFDALTLPALGIIGQALAAYDPVPFDLEEGVFISYAMGQLEKRLARLERSRGATLAEVNREIGTLIEQDDA
jgi:ribonucleoside-diphosphate reductase beta chain